AGGEAARFFAAWATDGTSVAAAAVPRNRRRLTPFSGESSLSMRAICTDSSSFRSRSDMRTSTPSDTLLLPPGTGPVQFGPVPPPPAGKCVELQGPDVGSGIA